MQSICMYTPSAEGGHALYTRELMVALTQHSRGGNRFELVTAQDLGNQFRSTLYPIHAILPPLLHRRSFRTKLNWAVSRVTHYPHREWFFHQWLRGQPDIEGVHFQEYTPWLGGPLFASVRRLGKKVFYTVHNIRPHTYRLGVPKGLWDHWNRQAWGLCDCLFVHTPRLRDELSQFLGKNHPPIAVIPHGVWNLSDSTPIPSVESRLKTKRLLFFGTIRRNKGIDLFLQAIERLPEYHFTIAGEPMEGNYFHNEVVPKIRSLQSKGISLELIDRYTSDEEATALFATHSAIVLPYTREFNAQSGVVFLALAHELPVVASEVGGLRDLFDQYRIGVTFKDLTPESLIEAIHAFYAMNPEELSAQIRSAKSSLSWNAAAGATITAYATAQAPLMEANGRAVSTAR